MHAFFISKSPTIHICRIQSFSGRTHANTEAVRAVFATSVQRSRSLIVNLLLPPLRMLGDSPNPWEPAENDEVTSYSLDANESRSILSHQPESAQRRPRSCSNASHTLLLRQKYGAGIWGRTRPRIIHSIPGQVVSPPEWARQILQDMDHVCTRNLVI